MKDKEPDAIIEWLNTILTDTQTFLFGRDILNFTSVFKSVRRQVGALLHGVLYL